MASKLQLHLDENQQNVFVSYFNSLPKKSALTLRFFNRGDFYTVHGADAETAARYIFRTTSFIKTIGSGKETLDTMILNKNQFESYVKDLLLVLQYRVEVYSNPGKKSQSSWTLEFKGSPGNLSQFEDILFSSDSDQVLGNSVLGVKYDGKTKTVGVALVDNVDHSFSVAEFPDDEHFSNLESVIVQFGPKECIGASDSSAESDQLKKITDRCGIMFTARRKSELSVDGLAQDLSRLLKFKDGQQQNAQAIPQFALTVAMSALNAVIKYLELISDSEKFGLYRIENLDRQRFVYLDSAAVSALSVSSPSDQPNKGQAMTIVDLLDKCRTAQGHRLLQQWVKQPLKDMNVINERLDIVELIFNDTILRQSLYEELLRKIPDLQVLSKKLERKKSNLQDCYRIFQAIHKLPSLIKALEESNSGECHPTLRDAIIDPLKDAIKDMAKYQDMIESTIDMSLVDKGEYLVKAEFDEDLQNLREKMDELEDSLGVELNRAARDLSLDPKKTLKLESNSQFGYFFRVTLKEEKCLRNNKKYHQIDTNKAGIRFRSDKLQEINEEYLAKMEQYTSHQESIVSEVTSIAAGYAPSLQLISGLLARLDVLTSFAVVASSSCNPYVRPKMFSQGSRRFKLSEARHPCVELVDNVSFIPNDAEFSEESLFHVITGPNMGGKSTFIRSIGCIALMAHIGSFVPCSSAEISILDAILARVGASDSTLKGMSTFMVEMVETAGILKMATRDSLVIIDELGRGTSTYEGCGIAWAIAEHLAATAKSFSLFATHFHELTRLADEIETVKNFHVTATTLADAFTLLYQVKPGACDQSFGIHVAQMARFPDSVIEEAKTKLLELEDYQSEHVGGNDVQKRKYILEGEELIKGALSKCKLLKLDEMTDDEVQAQIENLSKEVQSHDNPYIAALLNRKT
ncbi:mutS homolog 2 [Nesidiocoris tenuis]|uniref:MutS homolog 2 n=1 Tax=Nesidiocoris tenuis TaxID=355587 RepID=A0ABN7AMP9_9HEMI|nr:mutS homolog 2 [Nesidiocoris tenuis]